MIYRIKDWDTRYENNRSRDVKTLGWVPFSNRLDDDGYTFIIDLQNGAALWGAWTVIVLVASRCDPRGTLLRAGSIPHDSASLSRMTRIPKPLIEEILDLGLNEVKWLEIIETHDGAAMSQAGATIPQDAAQKERKKEGNGMNECSGPVEPPVGFPKSEDEAVMMGDRSGVPRDFTLDVYNQLSGRGYKDATGILIVNFSAHLKSRWSRKQSEHYEQKHYANHHSTTGGQRRTDLNAGTANDGKSSQFKGVGKMG